MTPSLAGFRILIAEDSWHIADAVRRALLQHGAVVVELVSSRQDLIAALGSARPDLVVADINLQGELVGDLLAAEAAAGQKVLAITGYDDEVTRLAERGVTALAKPVSPDRLVAAVSHLLKGA